MIIMRNNLSEQASLSVEDKTKIPHICPSLSQLSVRVGNPTLYLYRFTQATPLL